MAELSLEQVSSTVLELLQKSSPLHQEAIRDQACLRHPGRINLVMIKQSLARLKDQHRVEALQGGAWALSRSAQAELPSPAPTAGASATDRLTGSLRQAAAKGEEYRAEGDGNDTPSPAEPLTEHEPTANTRATTGQNQDQLWAAFEQSLRNPLTPLRDGVSSALIVAAHEWSLATPLLIRSAEDFKAIPSLKIEPYLHQVRAAIAFFRRLNPRGLIADDVGLGKTVTAGLILLELIMRRKIQGFVIIAPKMIQEQWRAELLEKFGIEASISVGKDLKRLEPGARLITTYQSAANHIEALKEARIDLVVFDEMHKLRNLHSPQPPRMALAFHAAQQARAFRYCLGLSATPLQNSLRDLFSLADILRTPNPTPYGTLKQFQSYYLADETGRRLKPTVQDEFRRRTSEFMHRTSRRDSKLPFPEREVVIRALSPTPEEFSLLAEALRIVFGGRSSPLQRIGLAQTILSSPAAALAAIDRKDSDRQATSAEELRALRERFSNLKETAKSRALVELVREIQKRHGDWRVLIFTIRRATADFIRDALGRAGLKDVVAVMQGGQARANQQAIQDFQADPPRRRVLVSTDAGAEGVNLQACNVVINFDLPWNPMIVEQRIGRVQRLGQKAKSVIVYNLVTRATIEESVVSRLFEKLRLYDAAIGLAEEILGQLTDDEEGFEAVVLRLAEQAVLRGNAEKALEQLRFSAEQAREELDRQRAEMDTTFGSTDEHESGPRVPEIKPTAPSLSDREFWTAAMEASGWTLKERSDGKTIEATRNGRKARRFTFDPNHPERATGTLLGSYAVELVAPDERPFEELVNAFATTGIDATEKVLLDVDGVLAPELVRLLAPRVVKVQSSEKAARTISLRLAPIARANINVAHDQFEKLVTGTEVRITASVEPGASPTAALATRAAAEAIARSIRDAVEADPDLRAFRSFYDQRRKEEIARIKRSEDERTLRPEAARRLIEDHRQRLTPLTEARLVCVNGRVEEAARVRMSVLLNSGRAVDVQLPALVPVQPLEESLRTISAHQVLPTLCDGGHWVAPDGLTPCADEDCSLQACALCSDWQRCIDCSDTRCSAHGTFCAGCKSGVCAAHAVKTDDGRTACSHCIAHCAVTHVRTVKSELVRCEDTHELVLAEHATKSASSGKWVRTSNVVRSEVSGLPAAPGELERCVVTGKWGLPGELVTTGPHGRRMLAGEAEQCADTKEYFERGVLVGCAVCEARVSPDRLVTSDVSGSRAHPTELVRCSVSGKRGLPSELLASPVSKRLALRTIFVQCESTGTLALPDEVANCGETGRRVLRSLLRQSSKTGRLALRELTGPCAVCGKVLLNSEMVPCAVTGRLADPACMRQSAVSGATALPTAMATCAMSGRAVLPSELVECAETQRLVASDRATRCAFTGVQVGTDLVVMSAYSMRPVRRSVAEISQATQRLAGPGELVLSCTGMKVLPDELDICPACGGAAVLREFGRSDRFECKSCRILCCSGDGRPTGICALCEAAPTITASSQPPSEVLARAPKMKAWYASTGARETVWIGRPGLLRFFSSAVMIRASNEGSVLFERPLG